MSEANRPKLKSLIAKITSNLVLKAMKKSQKAIKPTQRFDDDNNDDPDELLQSECKTLNEVYVDPMIAKLKTTNVSIESFTHFGRKLRKF